MNNEILLEHQSPVPSVIQIPTRLSKRLPEESTSNSIPFHSVGTAICPRSAKQQSCHFTQFQSSFRFALPRFVTTAFAVLLTTLVAGRDPSGRERGCPKRVAPTKV